MTDDLVTVRGLVDFEGTPLRSFDGIFAEYERKKAENYDGSRINLNFNELDNVVSITPYNFPTATINIGLSNKNKSRWGYFGNSLAAFLADDEDIRDCVGKKMSLVFCDGEDGRPEPQPIWNKDADPAEFPGKMVPTPVWMVVAVEGSSAGGGKSAGGSAADWAEENLIGKTRKDFNAWALKDPKVRKDADLQRAIVDKSFINTLIQLEKVVEDEDGVFQTSS